MWHEGTIGIPKGDKYTIAHYWVKAYEEGSEYGINNGRISKLTIKIAGKITANYDRGWMQSRKALYLVMSVAMMRLFFMPFWR